MGDKKQIGKILLRQRALSPEQLDKALQDPVEGRLASRLAGEGTITDLAALKALSEQHGVPGIDLNQVCLRLADLEILPREIAEKHLLLPVLARADRLFVAMANPLERKVVDELEFVTGKRVYPYVALEASLRRVIEQAYARRAHGDAYLVGPDCPPETLEKLGVDAEGNLRSPELSEENDQGLTRASMQPHETPGVVVEQGAEDRSADALEEDGFGDVSRELSGVTDLPDSEPGSSPPGSKAVLVVDDEQDVRQMLVRLLKSKGYKVLEADRGSLAVRILKEQKVDLVILDAMLPEVHGFDIARRMKGSKRYGNIPIVMVSAVYRGWRYAEDLRVACGVDHYVEKPFRIAEILSAVEQSLEDRSGPPVQREEVSAEAEQALTAGVEAYKAGRLEEAVSHLKRGVEIDPLAYRLHFHLGLLHGRMGQLYEAIRVLEKAIEINGKHFPALKNLAVLYQRAGFRNKAAEMWERALTVATDEATRKSIKEHLLSLL